MEANTTFTEKVTRAVKAELARRGLGGADLVEPLGMSRNAIYSRLRNESAFTTAELEKVVSRLGIDMDTLFASAALEDRETRRAAA